MQERRKDPRLNHNVPLKLKAGSFDLATETLNLSSSGVYCQSNTCIPAMTKVNILMLLPDASRNKHKKINCKGVIVRCEKSQKSPDKFDTAIFFNEISSRDSECLLHYIQGHLAPLVRYPRGAS